MDFHLSYLAYKIKKMATLKSNIMEASDVALLIHGGLGRIRREALCTEVELNINWQLRML